MLGTPHHVVGSDEVNDGVAPTIIWPGRTGAASSADNSGPLEGKLLFDRVRDEVHHFTLLRLVVPAGFVKKCCAALFGGLVSAARQRSSMRSRCVVAHDGRVPRPVCACATFR